MRRATKDRGEIIHFAGFNHLSPGLDPASRPAFSSAAGDGVTRCGWETFFTALRKGGLAVALDDADPSSVRVVPVAEVPSSNEHGGRLHRALEHSKRFWRALRGGRSLNGPSP